MDTIITELLKPVNLGLSILLVVFVCYWLITIIGGLDLDYFDIDLDFGDDADMDVDADSGFSFLKYLGIGEAPLMVVLTCLVLFAWAMSVVLLAVLGITSVLISLVLLIPILAVSAFITHYVAKPFGYFFRMLNKSSDVPFEVIGQECKIMTGEVTESFGQVEVERGGATLLMEARSKTGEIFQRGDTALVVETDKEAGLCYIRKVNDSKL